MGSIPTSGPEKFIVRKMCAIDLALPGWKETMEALSPLDCEPNDAIMYTAYEKRCLQDAHIFVAVASDGQGKEEIVGLATILFEQKLIHKCSIAGHIEDVAVRPDWQKRGVGKALMASLVGEARRRRAYKIVLDCIGSNVAFYERCGFYNNCYAMRMDLYYDANGTN